MADRYCGTIRVGGEMSEEQFAHIENLIEQIGDESEGDGQAYFRDCTAGDFAEIIDYCEKYRVPLRIEWEAKWDFNGMVEYFVDGRRPRFSADQNGAIMVHLYELQESNCKTIAEFIEQLGVPDFPDLKIITQDDV